MRNSVNGHENTAPEVHMKSVVMGGGRPQINVRTLKDVRTSI